MKLLHRYIFSSILTTTLIVTLAIAAITAVLGLVDELDTLDKGGMPVALQMVALQLPRGIYELFPIIVLLGTLLGLGGLASGSELVAMRASGVSLVRLSASTLRAGLVFALICLLIGEWIAPRAEALEQRLRVLTNTANASSKLEGGVWLRDGETFIHVGTVVSTQLLKDVQLYQFDAAKNLQMALDASTARFANGRWELLEARYTEFGDRETRAQETPRMKWKTDIDPALFQVSVLPPDRQTMSTLYQYSRYLERFQLDASQYQMAFWSRAAVPVMVLIMAILAIPFVVGPLRTTGAGQRMFVGMLVGVAFFLFNEITLGTGRVYGLSPFVSAWLPTAMLAVVALGWLGYLNWPAPFLHLLRPLRPKLSVT